MLIAIASHETQHVGSLRTAYLMRREEQDKSVDQWRWRGDVAREAFVKTFLEDEYFGPEDALLLLDADQLHPHDLLEKLRAHDLDMVCAHYYRRETSPIQSLCYELGDGTWPYLPYLHPPKEGLHEIAVTGFGCVLIKKKVFQAVKETLPTGASPVAIGTLQEVSNDHANWGPDFIFFHRARKLGYKLWLDASIESLHGVTIWLGHKSAEKLINYTKWADAAHELLESRLEMYGVNLEAFKQRKKILEARLEGLTQHAQEFEKKKAEGVETNLEEEYKLSISIYQLQGKVMEMNAWIQWAEKYPAIERPDQLPTTENTPKQTTIPDEVPDQKEAKKKREDVYRDQAIELAQMLPDAKYGREDGLE